ncbi:MAG: hypothetical protein OMM_01350 [Candidatus Magnetoglobus multicellularis str. Araruama]|uniref:Capsular polysaccharide synthesis enzyme CpsB n=1 Tax=Candidatus Magnetoglobus multicellularis str. Araruama TaxID=890399 RepID=A0A1V1PDB7_9BACT|nr:MAG: hypothetical protein OMM_01350 [Candidatus Magnetoglobus multicellularis str. Araruama]
MKMRKHALRSIFACIGLVCGILLSTQPIFAQGNIHYGRLNVNPQVGISLEHNNNIFSESKDEIEDVILKIKPGIQFEYLDYRPNNYFQSGYDLEFASYFKRNNNNYQKHAPYLLCGMQTPTGFIVRFSERFMKTADPLGSATQYGKGRRTARTENTLDFTFGQYFTDRLSIEAMYQNFAIRYRDANRDQWQDRTDNIFSLGMYMLLTESRKTSMLAEYRFTNGTYERQVPADNSQDHNINTFLVGFRFEPGSKLMGSAKLGYEGKSFDNSLDMYGNRYEDNSTWVIETNIQFQMTPITNLGFQFIRSIEGAPDRDAASYVDTNIGFNLMHQVQHKTFFKSGLSWVNSDYRDEIPGIANKYFNLYKLFFGLDYKIQEWMTTSCQYSYETKTASHSDWYSSEYSTSSLFVEVNAMF